MSRYYDIDGNPLAVMEWAALFDKRGGGEDWWRIGETTIGDARVSTVWLGLDHNCEEGPPLIFEMKVFGGPLDGEMERYSTKEQAAEGHARWAAKVAEAGSKQPKSNEMIEAEPWP